jgi:hypothetical protein
MAEVAGGAFLMGSNASYGSPEYPAHTVRVDPFLLGTAEVTQGEFREYLDALAATVTPLVLDEVRRRVWPGRGAPEPGRLDWPVTLVTYAEACGYAAWRGCRLPTEEELEWAARGAEGRERASRLDGGEVWRRLHAVRSLAGDATRAPADAEVFGLYSNAAEVTLHRYRRYVGDFEGRPTYGGRGQLPGVRRRRTEQSAWGYPVRCGIQPGSDEPLGYVRRGVIPDAVRSEVVGFRLARSLRPMFPPSDVTLPEPGAEP